MMKRFLVIGCLILSGAIFPAFAAENASLEATSAGQVVKFRITIPELRPLQLDANSVRLSRRDFARAGDAETTSVVADRYGRHHLRQTRQHEGMLRMTLATP